MNLADELFRQEALGAICINSSTVEKYFDKTEYFSARKFKKAPAYVYIYLT